jgi:hypothetical protein
VKCHKEAHQKAQESFASPRVFLSCAFCAFLWLFVAILRPRVIVAAIAMLRRFQICRAVWPLLCGLLVVAACTNAMACALCPQEIRPVSHCSSKDAGEDSQHSVNHEASTVFTEQGDGCSHCVTHSTGTANSTSRAVVLNPSSHDVVAVDPPVVAVNFSSSTKLVEIHDHGPPGRGSPRYVLNHSFRI